MTEKVKMYFKKECQLRMLALEHEQETDFYLTCWQQNRAIWPLLLIRTILFLGCIGNVVSSMVLMTQELMGIGHWFVFMTHWGLIFNMIAAGLACAVSLVEFFKGRQGTNPPWLVKLYWVCFNSTISIAFFITLFYWTLLTDVADTDYALNPALDVFIHGINSVMMFLLLVTSRQPTRLLHFYMPLLVGIIYMLFSIIYYWAGGLGPFGTGWIYPMLDWSKPGTTILLALGSAFGIVVLHFVVVAITVCRDALTKRCREPTLFTLSDQNEMSTNYYR